MRKIPYAYSLLILLFTLGAIGQQPARSRPLPAKNVDWQTVNVNKLGFLAIAMPPGLKGSEDSDSRTDTSSGQQSDYFDQTWNVGSGKSERSINIMIHSTHADFATALGRPGSTITPEMLLALRIYQDQQSISDKRIRVKQAAEMTISDVPGSMVAKRDPATGRFLMIWGTYRYFDNCAQEIMVSVDGMNREDALRIVRSITLAPSDKK